MVKIPSNTKIKITLGSTLQPLHSCKYLGFELNSNLDFDQQLRLVQTKIRSIPYLKKDQASGSQTRNSKMFTGFSNFAYSAPILDSLKRTSKAEIYSFHCRNHRLIDIRKNEFDGINEVWTKITFDLYSANSEFATFSCFDRAVTVS